MEDTFTSAAGPDVRVRNLHVRPAAIHSDCLVTRARLFSVYAAAFSAGEEGSSDISSRLLPLVSGSRDGDDQAESANDGGRGFGGRQAIPVQKKGESKNANEAADLAERGGNAVSRGTDFYGKISEG